MVPDGWKLSTIGEHVELLTGFPFKSEYYSDSPEDLRLLRGDNIGQGSLRWRDAERWPANQLDRLDKYFLKTGDFVIAMDRTWISAGVKVSEVREADLPCLLVQRVCRLRAKRSLDQRLLRYWFSVERFSQYVRRAQTETAVPHINSEDIREFPILLPPLGEQHEIAQILETWDRAIQVVGNLIEKHEMIKRALLQRCLRRSSQGTEGSAHSWCTVRLGDVADVRVSNVDKTSSSDESSVLLCNYTDVYYNSHITRHLELMKATATESQIANFALRKGDVLITKDSETPDDIAVAAVVDEDMPTVLCGYHLALLRPRSNDIDGNYLRILFLLRETQHYFLTRANGVTRFGLTIGAIRGAPLTIPPIEEQRKVARVIWGYERIIENYKSQLVKLTRQREGLMQQLLTGKRRVRAEESAAPIAANG